MFRLTTESWTDANDATDRSIEIKWNAYGKVQHVALEDGAQLEFLYNAAQQRVAKIHRGPLPLDPATGDDDIYTYYTHDPSGNILAIYERRMVPIGEGEGYTDLITLSEQPLYGAQRLGMRTPGAAPIVVRQWEHPLAQPAYEVQNNRQFKSEVDHLELAVRFPFIIPPVLDLVINLHTGPDLPLTVSPSLVGQIGTSTANIYAAEDVQGNNLFTTQTVLTTDPFGPPGSTVSICTVWDTQGDLMAGTQNVQATSQSATLSAQVPEAPTRHYLFTQTTTNNLPVLNVVDLAQTAVSQGALVAPYNSSLHLAGNHRYARCMAVLDERATIAPSMLYLKRGGALPNTTQLVAVNLDTWAQTQSISQSAAVAATFPGTNNTQDMGEMQLSPDGRYLAVTARQQISVFGDPVPTHLRLYRVNAADGSLVLVSTATGQVGITGLDFSPNSNYLYYIRSGKLMRMDVPGLTTAQDLLQRANEVRRTVHGHMLFTWGQQVKTVTQPELPSLALTMASVTTPWTNSTPQLFADVALQPLVVYTAQPVAQRHVGHKHYELTDHLGNVRVVVSDMKLSSLGVNNEPYSFTGEVVSRTDYYAFGSPMPKRHYPASGYRFGFNGMEKDDEVKGPGNGNSTYWRQYDPRVGRWLSFEPKPVAWESGYAAFRNNSIFFADPNGDWVKGAGFFRNMFNSDAKINAKDKANATGGIAFKDGNGWTVNYSSNETVDFGNGNVSMKTFNVEHYNIKSFRALTQSAPAWTYSDLKGNFQNNEYMGSGSKGKFGGFMWYRNSVDGDGSGIVTTKPFWVTLEEADYMPGGSAPYRYKGYYGPEKVIKDLHNLQDDRIKQAGPRVVTSTEIQYLINRGTDTVSYATEDRRWNGEKYAPGDTIEKEILRFRDHSLQPTSRESKKYLGR